MDIFPKWLENVLVLNLKRNTFPRYQPPYEPIWARGNKPCSWLFCRQLKRWGPAFFWPPPAFFWPPPLFFDIPPALFWPPADLKCFYCMATSFWHPPCFFLTSPMIQPLLFFDLPPTSFWPLPCSFLTSPLLHFDSPTSPFWPPPPSVVLAESAGCRLTLMQTFWPADSRNALCRSFACADRCACWVRRLQADPHASLWSALGSD